MTSLPRPAVGPAPIWHSPTPEIHRLANGLAVWIYDRPGQYVISAALVIDLPLVVEPLAHEGVATICLRTLDEGTVDHPGPAFAEVLEACGAVFGGSAALSATTCSVEMPVTSYADAMALFAEAVLTPLFAADDVARHVALRLADIEQHRANPSQLAGVLVRSALFDPSCRAARMNGGLSRTVASITPDHVREFHGRFYRPDGAVLILAGDFLGQDPLPAVEHAFGVWSGTADGISHPSPVPTAATRRIVRRDGAVQTDVRLAGAGIDRTDPRWPAFQVASYAMGGAFLSRLNRVLREDRGYTYGVSMSAHPLRTGGYWTVGASFRNEVAIDAIDELRAILDLGAAPITADEVIDAVSYLTGIAPLRYATASGLVEQVAALVAAGMDPGYVDRSLARLRAVTPEAATEAYRDLVTDPTLVIVGDPAALGRFADEAEDAPEL
jgi:predicted Zn-dependent peptidase